MKIPPRAYHSPEAVFQKATTTEDRLLRLADLYMDAYAWRGEEAQLLHRYRLRLEAVEEMLTELVEQLGGLQ